MIRKRKVLLLVVCLMAVGLIASLISGCAGGGGGSGGAEEPQYGGILNVYALADPVGWDDAYVGGTMGCSHASVRGPYQCLWSGDWTKGNAGGYGSKECDWFLPGSINRLEQKTGYIADSWTIGEDYITFTLNDEATFQDVPPTRGRAVTADDVVFSLNRHKVTGCYFANAYPDTAAAMSISKVDENTVRIDCDPASEMPVLISMIDFMYIFPKEVIETYGDMNDWERAIGSGPFTLEEYVVGSSLYYEKSDNYWETYPVIGSPGDGDQLPYLDGIKVLIEPDPSTREALFTTGQIDYFATEYDRAQSVMTSCPDAEYIKYFQDSSQLVIAMRLDNPLKPYGDVRVRQALMLAIDNQKIVDELFGGDGDVLYWPLTYCKEYAGAYLELDDYPDEPVLGPDSCTVDELFGYDPTKAKQLLADAGYPDGFKAEIVALDYYVYTDQLTAVQDYWADIGVELTVDPVDSTTHQTIQYFHSYDDMLYAITAGASTYFKGTNWWGEGMYNASLIDDPVLNDYRDQMMAVVLTDEDEAFRIHREMLPYLQEQCYVIQIAAFSTYRFWQPWVKNYSGEGSLGYYKFISNGFGNLCQYIWIDQDLKEDMLG